MPVVGSPNTNVLPPGFPSLPIDGDLTGSTATSSGHYSFLVQIADSDANTHTQRFAIDVRATLFPVAVHPTPGEEGMFYTYQFKVADGTGTILTSGYSITVGAEPDGTSMNGAGLLSGTLTDLAIGTTYFTLTVTDGSDSIDIPIKVDVYSEMKTDPDTSPYVLPDALLGIAYEHRIVGADGLPPYRFAISFDALTAIGMKLTPDGVVKGKPTAAGLFTSSFNATDALGSTNVAGRSLPLRVRDPGSTLQLKFNGVNVGPPMYLLS
jgi:hypothetical protein